MMKKLFYFCFLCALGAAMTSCYTHREIGLLQQPNKCNRLPQYDSAEYVPYKIRVNDEIIYRLITMDETISNSIMGNNQNMAGQYANSYRVYSDGTIDVPFLQPVRVAGLTVEQAQDTLRAAFREIIPDADVKLALYNKYFTVIGDINSGEYYVYKEKLNIFQALAMTGDLMNSGDRKHVRIIRPHDGAEPEVLEFDIRTNSIIDSKYYYVYPNDVIYVARTKDSFFKTASYTGFLGLITGSVSLLVTVLNYTMLIPNSK